MAPGWCVAGQRAAAVHDMLGQAPMRTKAAAIAGSAGFLVIAPGVVAGLVPWWLTGWQRGAEWPAPVRVAGGLLIAAGAATLLGSFAQFALEGRGTPAPPAPTEHLVVRGLYRYVRNPMYLAVTAAITGQALVLGRPGLLGYAGVVAAAFVAFVYGYEQPALARRYGAEYAAYRREVPGWWPRLAAARKAPSP
jgi:protein-S-isoprenylcysteine O-methyltransferase Ste14